jgi:WD40 repeat protein
VGRRSAAPLAEVAALTPDPAADLTWREVQGALDEELARLPEKYRAPLVLCYLEGLARDEAAACLGCPLGTLKGRLERGRDLLRQRLTRRGLALAAALAAVGLGRAAVPPALAAGTVRVAAAFAAGAPGASAPVALAEAALRDLAAKKFRAAAVLLLGLTALAAGMGLLASQNALPPSPADQPAMPPGDRPAGEPKGNARGDPLPVGAVARLGTLPWRHDGEGYDLAFAPDGKTLAVTGHDGEVVVFDTATGKVLRRHVAAETGKFTGRVVALAYSPDGKRLAVSGAPGEVRLLDAATGKEARRLVVAGDPVLRRDPLFRFTPDGKALAVSTGRGGVHLYDPATGDLLRSVGDPRANVAGFAVSPDAKLIALAAGDPPLQLWDAAAGTVLREVKGHDRPPNALAFAADGKVLAAGWTGKVVLSDVNTGQELGRIEFKADHLLGLAFTPDGKTLVGGDADGKVWVWDVATRKERHVLDARRWIGRAMALSPDGKTVAMATVYNVLRLWDVASGKELFPEPEGHDAPVRAVAFSPDGKLVVSGGPNGNTHLWDAADGRHVRRLAGNSAGTVSFAPDGKRLATVWTWNTTVRVWDGAGGEELLKLPHKDSEIVPAAVFSADGKRVVSAGWKRSPDERSAGVTRLYVWDAATGKALRDVALDEVRAECLALAPDGRTAAVGGYPLALRLRDLERGRELTLRGHEHNVEAVAFSPDGQVLASGSIDQTVRLWEVATGREVATLKGHERSVMAVAFSPDGRVVASGEGSDSYPLRGEHPRRIRFWDVATGRELAALEGHDSNVLSLALSPDGRRLASGLGNGTVLLWDVPAKAKVPPPPARELTAKELDALWADLAGDDAGQAHRAVNTLAAAADKAVPFLKARLRSAEAIDPKKLAKWLADLDADDFDARDRAAHELYRLGAQAEPELRKALAAKPSAEAKRDIEAILKALEGPLPSDQLRAVRAVRALEAAGSPAARELLKALAEGAPAARQTADAKAALERSAKRPPAPEGK